MGAYGDNMGFYGFKLGPMAGVGGERQNLYTTLPSVRVVKNILDTT